MLTGRDENFKATGYEKILAHKTRLGVSADGEQINGDLCYTTANSEENANELLAHLCGNGPRPKIDGGY